MNIKIKWPSLWEILGFLIGVTIISRVVAYDKSVLLKEGYQCRPQITQPFNKQIHEI